MRYSIQRDTILSVIRESQEHLSASEVYSEVKKEINDISLGTVYRNLAQLVSSGFITQIKGIDDRTYYDKNVTAHGHLFCDTCKKVTDTHHDLASKIRQDALTNSGFKIKEYNLSISGVCHECQEK